MNREVHLTKRVLLGNGLRFCPIVKTANGRIKLDCVLVGGKEERHSEGAYYIEWYQDGKRIRQSVGKDAALAETARLRRAAEINARNHGIAVVPEQNGRSLVIAVETFLAEIRSTKKPGTFDAYNTALSYFLESCHKSNLEDITRTDLLDFATFLRQEKQHAPRSVYNKFQLAVIFLKAQGITKLTSKKDLPSFTAEEPEVYEQEELDALFAACTEEEKIWYEFFLMTGMRDQEVIHTEWSDIKFTANTVKVSYKPERGWSPKAYKERSIPLHPKLAPILREWKEKSKDKNGLVFPNSFGKPNRYFIESLKRIAKRAGLDPKKFWLHKFRATFATWSLWAGVDLRTVQQWLGHSDIESTMRYLSSGTGQRAQDLMSKINF